MWKNRLQDPLVLFLLLGAVLFGASHWFSSQRADRERRISITPQLVAQQRALHEAQLGVTPDPATLETLVQTYVRDEALYREAKRLLLEQDDSVIRQRLIQKMEVLLTDATAVPIPTDAQLAEHLRTHAVRFRIATRVSFEQRYFAANESNARSPEQRAAAALRQLAAGQTTKDSDSFALGDTFSDIDSDELISRFGESEMAGAALSAPLNAWAGPFKSGYGLHLIRVSHRVEGALPALNSVKESLIADWTASFREQERDRRIAALIAKHEVLRIDRTAQ
jgi:peptidyl-prolyl cis-trans isomerase C